MEVALIVCIGWIVSVCFHEFGHAIVAYIGGDTTVKDKGYLTFNIFKYTDPGMTLFFPVLILMLGGIALPGAAVYIEHWRLRSRLWQSAVAAAGPLATAISGVLLALPFLLHFFPPAVPDDVWNGLAFLIMLQAYALILNSLPIPPFDGYGVIEPWLPESLSAKINELSRYSIWIVILVLWTVPPVNHALWSVTETLSRMVNVNPRWAAIGQVIFQKNAGWLVLALVTFLFLMNRKGKQQATASPETHLQAAKVLIEQNRPVDAVDQLNQAITINENYGEAWQLRGVCFGLMNRNEEALQNFDKAISVDQQNANAWYNRACCLALQGRYDEALSDLTNAVKLNPQSVKQHAKQDVGFRPLWNDARFQQLVS